MGALDGLLPVAGRLMAKFGTSATLRSVSTGAYDPDTGTATPVNTDTTVSVRLEPVDSRRVDDQIRATDQVALMAAQGNTAPTTDDKLIVGGDVYEIVRVSTLYATDSAITYEMVVRR